MNLIALITLFYAAISAAKWSKPLGCAKSMESVTGPLTSLHQGVQTCMSQCDEIASTKFIAIKNASECYCTNVLPKANADPKECNMACPEFHPMDLCGGKDTYSLYATENAVLNIPNHES
ncbi:Carbohydrate-binding WSC [Ascosphaera apis ARSEF 7405]|uniref:Carbohydrate-binding WSC n=1 Tax=Ascosphaera apis ARSEF 7405 TaxID=392613 RepID=A0A162IEF7_9EURO|nr:Carbohydrate-binding WSC [Ascosphaera apis ARSEF 7405]